MRRTTTNEWTVLGASLHVTAITPLQKKTAEIQRMTQRLEKIEPHQALYLLTRCMGVAKVLYLLRTCPAWHYPIALRGYDDVIRGSMEQITNTKLTSMAANQAALPVKWGGLGVRSVEAVALPAFSTSACFVVSLVHQIAHVDMDLAIQPPAHAWEKLTMCLFPHPALRNHQRTYDEILIADNVRFLLYSAANSKADTAKRLTSTTKPSGAWLQA